MTRYFIFRQRYVVSRILSLAPPVGYFPSLTVVEAIIAASAGLLNISLDKLTELVTLV